MGERRERAALRAPRPIRSPARRAPSRALAAALLASFAAASSAPAAIPSLLWDGVRQVGVHCLVQSSTLSLAPGEQAALCEKVRAAVGHGAPMRVIAVEPGHPAMIRHDTVLVLFHAAIERSGSGRTLAFSVRPLRPGSEGEIYFGAAPRAVKMSRNDAALDRPLRAALSEILPWQRSPEPLGRPL